MSVDQVDYASVGSGGLREYSDTGEDAVAVFDYEMNRHNFFLSQRRIKWMRGHLYSSSMSARISSGDVQMLLSLVYDET